MPPLTDESWYAKIRPVYLDFPDAIKQAFPETLISEKLESFFKVGGIR